MPGQNYVAGLTDATLGGLGKGEERKAGRERKRRAQDGGHISPPA